MKNQDQIVELEDEISRLRSELKTANQKNKKMMGAAEKALIHDKIENSQWLKDNVRLSVSMIKPTLLKHMQVEFDGEHFRTLNLDKKGNQIFSVAMGGRLYAEGDEAIERIIRSMPDCDKMLKEKPGEPGSDGQKMKRDVFVGLPPAEKMTFVRTGGQII